jgi:SecD/SecF fusion protein
MKRYSNFLIISLFISAIILSSCDERENYTPGNLQFYETYFPSEIASQWQQATIASRSKEVKSEDIAPADSSDTTKPESLTSFSNLGGAQKGLADYVKIAGNYGLGFVSPEDKSAVDAILNRRDIQLIFPEDMKFMWSADLEKVDYKSNEKAFILYAIRVHENSNAKVGGKDIKSASTGFDQTSGRITVDLSMTEEGADKWAMMTADNLNRIVAITMDDVVYSTPTVMSQITGGNTQISGGFTYEFAQKLCDRINSFSSNK